MPRWVAAALALALGASPAPGAQNWLKTQPQRLSVRASAAPATIRSGEPFALVIEVTPQPGIHVYAPGNPDYIPVSVTIAPQPGLRIGAVSFPPPEDYFFAPLAERVKVYTAPFTVSQGLVWRLPAGGQRPARISVAGGLRYQACDDRVCFPPATVPVTIDIPVGG